MASLIPGYEYDIFISYRQKDNKYDGWVTEFVDNLKRELEATFKEDVNVYFDINPHDGLLETHDVDASLKEKLKCLVFIPIISRTYCDPKSFAWGHEFKAFVESASKDQFGLKVKLPNGNVANRVLPVRIHDLDIADIKLCESVLGGVLRGVEFIYKEPGVNRSLTPKDKEKKNLNGTIYRNQINKVALAIKEIILGLQAGEDVSGKEKAESQLPWEEANKGEKIIPAEKHTGFKRNKLLSYTISAVFVLVLIGIYAYPKIFKGDTLQKLRTTGEKISIAVMPFQNITNDTIWNVLQAGIQSSLISSLANTGELRVRQKDDINTLLKNKNSVDYASISPNLAGTISQKLNADIFIYGSIQKAGAAIRVDAQLIDTKTEEVFKSFKIERPSLEENIFQIIDTLALNLKNYLLISKLIKGNPSFNIEKAPLTTNSPEALRFCIYGDKALASGDNGMAVSWYLQSLSIDSNYFDPMIGLSSAYANQGMQDQNYKWVLKYYNKKEQWPPLEQLWASWAYAFSFESPEEAIKYLKKIQVIDDRPLYILGFSYNRLKQYDKAIPEFEKCLEMARSYGKEFLKDNWCFSNLGHAYHQTGQYKKEKKITIEWEKYYRDGPNIILRWIAMSLAEKDTIAANRYIKKFKSAYKEKWSSSEADLTGVLALIYSNEPDIIYLDKAEEYYRKALSLEPENPGRINSLANFLIENNRNLKEVSDLMDKAMGLTKSKIDYYDYLNTKGWGQYKQGKAREALEILQKCWDEAPFKLYSIRSHLEEVKKSVAGQK
jgi:TolB-like protein